ncbi:MAG TPA: isoamylase early set domain-containing protein [Acidimicrobiales bacterium]|nr:isoamylase early set domain-containing protein [Acidimicrobiales bacterium]
MIQRESRKGDGPVKVTFEIPADGADSQVSVVGDFNDWDPLATPLVRRGKTMRASVVLDAGRRYAFRYLADGGRWFDDDAADDHQMNGFGGSDSVVDLTASP